MDQECVRRKTRFLYMTALCEVEGHRLAGFGHIGAGSWNTEHATWWDASGQLHKHRTCNLVRCFRSTPQSSSPTDSDSRCGGTSLSIPPFKKIRQKAVPSSKITLKIKQKNVPFLITTLKIWQKTVASFKATQKINQKTVSSSKATLKNQAKYCSPCQGHPKKIKQKTVPSFKTTLKIKQKTVPSFKATF